MRSVSDSEGCFKCAQHINHWRVFWKLQIQNYFYISQRSNGARPLAGTVMTIKLGFFQVSSSSKIYRLSKMSNTFCLPDDLIQNWQQNLKKLQQDTLVWIFCTVIFKVICYIQPISWIFLFLFMNSCIHPVSLHWRHNGHDSVLNHQPHDCLLNRLFRRRSKKRSKLRITGLCVGNSPETGEFPAQMASNAENISIWWRHHGPCTYTWHLCSIT